MHKYRFRAVNRAGQILKGQMEVANENHLSLRLADMGYEVLAFRPQQDRRWAQLLRQENMPQQQILLFTQLAALADAGVPLVTCLEDAMTGMPVGRLRDTVRAVAQDLRDGQGFAAAFGRHRAVFSPTVVALLQAGMAGGDPGAAFRQARDHIKWQAELGAMLRKALRYPLFLLALTMGTMSFMLLFVVPQLIAFLTAQDFALPWQTRALVWLAQGFTMLWWVLPLLAGMGAGAILLLRRHVPDFVETSDGWLLRLPLLGAIIGKVERAHFLHHLALMIAGGVPILGALETARLALTNRALQRQAAAIAERVAEGADLALAMQAQPGFPGIVARRAQIGLQSGNLAEQLRHASLDFDAEAAERSKQLIAGLEPVLTMTVGLLLSWIVLAVLMPLYHSLGQLGYAP